jgi:ABC-type uncharacterized transport system permease subunit
VASLKHGFESHSSVKVIMLSIIIIGTLNVFTQNSKNADQTMRFPYDNRFKFIALRESSK